MSAEEVAALYARLSPEAQAEVERLMKRLLPPTGGETGKTPTPLFGALKGKVRMAPDFDEIP